MNLKLAQENWLIGSVKWGHCLIFIHQLKYPRASKLEPRVYLGREWILHLVQGNQFCTTDRNIL